MYVLIDIWFFEHEPDHRNVVMTHFTTEFINIFTQALDSQNIQTLFRQRATRFAQLAKSGADL